MLCAEFCMFPLCLRIIQFSACLAPPINMPVDKLAMIKFPLVVNVRSGLASDPGCTPVTLTRKKVSVYKGMNIPKVNKATYVINGT